MGEKFLSENFSHTTLVIKAVSNLFAVDLHLNYELKYNRDRSFLLQLNTVRLAAKVLNSKNFCDQR